MYSQALDGPLIKLGVEGLARTMVNVLEFADVPQSFTEYTDNTLVVNPLANVIDTAVSFAPEYKFVNVAVVVGTPLVVNSQTYDDVESTFGILYITGTLVPMLGQILLVDAVIADGVVGLTAVK